MTGHLEPRLGARTTIPLRNDEAHVCVRSAQPPRVPVDRSTIGTVEGEKNYLMSADERALISPR
jgi:hypothetical protein